MAGFCGGLGVFRADVFEDKNGVGEDEKGLKNHAFFDAKLICVLKNAGKVGFTCIEKSMTYA